MYGGCTKIQNQHKQTEYEVNQFKPINSFVPNEETAIKIAEAVWLPLYGRKILDSERPFKASLKGDNWFATGTLPENSIRGTAKAMIAKVDGRILNVTNEQ